MLAYRFLLLVHVFLATLAIGTHLALPVLLRYAARHPERIPDFLPFYGRLALTAKFSGMAVAATGLLLVGIHPGLQLLEQGWLWLSLCLYLLIAAQGQFRLRPMTGQLGALAAREAPREQVEQHIRRMTLWLHAMSVLWVAVLALMVLKPAF